MFVTKLKTCPIAPMEVVATAVPVNNADAVAVPIDDMANTPTFGVTIPHGANPGASFNLTAPSGSQHQMVVPEGASPGMTLTCLVVPPGVSEAVISTPAGESAVPIPPGMCPGELLVVDMGESLKQWDDASSGGMAWQTCADNTVSVAAPCMHILGPRGCCVASFIALLILLKLVSGPFFHHGPIVHHGYYGGHTYSGAHHGGVYAGHGPAVAGVYHAGAYHANSYVPGQAYVTTGRPVNAGYRTGPVHSGRPVVGTPVAHARPVQAARPTRSTPVSQARPVQTASPYG